MQAVEPVDRDELQDSTAQEVTKEDEKRRLFRKEKRNENFSNLFHRHTMSHNVTQCESKFDLARTARKSDHSEIKYAPLYWATRRKPVYETRSCLVIRDRSSCVATKWLEVK